MTKKSKDLDVQIASALRSTTNSATSKETSKETSKKTPKEGSLINNDLRDMIRLLLREFCDLYFTHYGEKYHGKPDSERDLHIMHKVILLVANQKVTSDNRSEICERIKEMIFQYINKPTSDSHTMSLVDFLRYTTRVHNLQPVQRLVGSTVS